MPKGLSLTLAAILAAGSLAGPAYPQKPEIAIQQLSGDVLNLQGQVKELQRSMDTRTNNMQTLIERMLDKVNVLNTDIQSGVQTAVQAGVQNNAQATQAAADKLARAIEEVKSQNDRSDKALTTAVTAIAALTADIERLNTSMVDRIGEKIDRVGEKTDKLGVQLTKTYTEQLTEKTGSLGASLNKVTQSFNDFQLQMDALNKRLEKLAAEMQIKPLPSPEEKLREAYLDFSANNYSLALETLGEILTGFPEHPVAPKAELLRGNIYYNQGKCETAIISYDAVLQKYRDQDSRKPALFKKGLCQEKLKQTEWAILTFKTFMADYPDADELVGAKEALIRLAPPPPPPPAPARGAAAPPRG